MENYLVQTNFQFKYKYKRGKKVFAIKRHTFPSSKQVT